MSGVEQPRPYATAASAGSRPDQTLPVRAALARSETGIPFASAMFGASPPLPRQFSSFVGRRRELEQLREALAQTRLLTVIGPGGAGKTRLALELAVEAGEPVHEHVAWVELAALLDPALVGRRWPARWACGRCRP
jgi:hypothetical protein